MRHPRTIGAAIVVGALLIGGCTSGTPTVTPTFPSAPTPKAITPRSCVGITTATGVAAGGLPDISLPCLGSGTAVGLARLRGPAVVNVWSSWCGPCVTELPVMARFAAGTSKIAVVGIDYEDPDHSDALSALSQAEVRYPSVVDAHGRIGVAGVPPLPTTFFVNAAGRVVFHQIVPYSTLAALEADVERYLGVRTG